MANEDLSDDIDIDALARLLATPEFDVTACRERMARYAREGDGEAGRGIEQLSRAFKAHHGDRLVDHKPALIAELRFTRRGGYSQDLGYRSLGILGHAIWHTYHSTRLLDASPFAIMSVMSTLHAHAEGDIDRVGRDLVSWIELGDEATRDRLTPVVQRAGAIEVRQLGDDPAVGARTLEVLGLGVPRMEDKLDRILANAVERGIGYGHLSCLAIFLATHDGPADVPAWEAQEGARRAFEVFWRLTRSYRSLFERHIALFADWSSRTDEALHLLGIIDEEVELKKAGARNEPWRIMRAGRVVMTTTGESLAYLPRFTAVCSATETAARKAFATKLEKKRAPAKKPVPAKPGRR